MKTELEAKKQEAKELKKQLDSTSEEAVASSSRSQELEEKIAGLEAQLQDAITKKATSTKEKEKEKEKENQAQVQAHAEAQARIKELETELEAKAAEHRLEVQTAVDKQPCRPTSTSGWQQKSESSKRSWLLLVECNPPGSRGQARTRGFHPKGPRSEDTHCQEAARVLHTKGATLEPDRSCTASRGRERYRGCFCKGRR